MNIYFVLSLLFFSLGFHALADGGEPQSREHSTRAFAKAPPPDSLPPKLDERLPPVLPGQEVTINGKKMRVFSTSGPVPALQEPPQAPHAPGQSVLGQSTSGQRGPTALGEIGVIVDRRDEGSEPKKNP